MSSSDKKNIDKVTDWFLFFGGIVCIIFGVGIIIGGIIITYSMRLDFWFGLLGFIPAIVFIKQGIKSINVSKY